MQPLDYENPRHRDDPPLSVFIVPAISVGVTVFALFHNAIEEPFMVFNLASAIIQVGSPFISLFLWLYWCWVTLRAKLHRTTIVAVLLGALLQLLFAFALGASYFSEGWNT